MTHAQLPARADHVTAPSTPPGLVRPKHRRRLLAVLSASSPCSPDTLWTNTRPVTLTASTEIEATPDQVWRVLTDFAAYPQWNPFMTSDLGEGDLGRRPGKGRPHAHPPARRRRRHDLRPEVLTVSPGRELRWLGKVAPGWIADGEHRFLIERLGPHRVRLTQSERFTGVAVPFVQGRLRADTLPQFRAMNTAVARLAAG